MAKSFDPTRLGDRDYRMNNLYKVQTKQGGVVDFVMKPAQRMYVEASWWRNIILKPRQLGYTTVIDLLGLDLALFRPNTSVVIIAHTGDAAKDIFRRVVKFAYDNLHPELKKILHLAEKPSQSRLAFANGSQIQVSTGARSGTHQMVHISEFGPLSVLYPAKAQEIMTGTIETVSSDGYVVIESTASGPVGAYYEMMKVALENKRLFLQGKKIFTRLDYMPHTLSWDQEEGYQLPSDGTPLVLPKVMEDYFESLRCDHGKNLTEEQKRWYFAKWQALGEDGDRMKCEYPSTPDEPFQATMVGRIFDTQISEAIKSGRVGKYPPIANWPCEVFLDLGARDSTVCIFTQTVGNQIRIIDYYRNEGQPISHYALVFRMKGYRYSTIFCPHDGGATSLQTGKTTMEQAQEHGLFMTRVPRIQHKIEAINATRSILGKCCFNEDKCGELIERLNLYRWKIDRNTGKSTGKPIHDDAADAAMTMAQGHSWGLDSASGTSLVQSGAY